MSELSIKEISPELYQQFNHNGRFEIILATTLYIYNSGNFIIIKDKSDGKEYQIPYTTTINLFQLENILHQNIPNIIESKRSDRINEILK